MKKLSLLWLVLAMVVGTAYAAPVDVNVAKAYGLKYVQNTLGQKSAELSLVYTGVSNAGTEALYIFNYDHGYVIVAADDRAHPILGYCDDMPFDANNIPEGLQYYLGYYARQIQFAIDNDLPTDYEIANQWYLVGKEGVMSHAKGSSGVDPLLSTLWDQGYPYNYYAPECNSYWTGNHCYAGCVACAMSQVMKFWNWPETGNGEHSYNTSTYGGELYANFGATTYNWAIMPNSLGSTATEAAKAVALLMYHCGVAVDMDYDPSGSGAHTEDVPQAVIDYFRYGSGTYLDTRDNYVRYDWENMLIESFDRGLPVLYSGSDNSGGHAFNCDGYNDQRMFHFNWGWSGSYNNWYQIDALNTGNGSFNMAQRVVFEMVPDYVYDLMVPQMESLEATTADANTKTVHVSWTVPTESASGVALESIGSIVLKRNGEELQTFNNPQLGETISFEDNVTDYGCYEYTIYGVNNGYIGKPYSTTVMVGPNCTWKFVCQTTNFQGWNWGRLQVVGANGIVVKEITMTSSSPLSEKFQMPEGAFSLNWISPNDQVSSLTITLKNSAGQNVYNFTGSSNQLSGTLFTGDNDCLSCTPPTGLTGEYHYEDGMFGTLISWNCDYDPSSFKVYRSEDGIEYEAVATVENTQHEYFDVVDMGSYFYKVTAFSSACESTPAMTNENTDYIYVTVTGVNEQSINASIFPNPVKEMLSIQAADINEVVVYNIMGQSVYRYQGLTNLLEVNTSCFEPGVYLVNVITTAGQASHRIVVMR